MIVTEDQISNVLEELVPELIRRNVVLTCAESCTGGWLAKSITDLQGSSGWFDCSIVTYSNQAKIKFLGVQKNTLEQYGAVSQEVVNEMVSGVLERSSASLGISISGIAGPGGGSVDKPVGTVWIAWGDSKNIIETKVFMFEGDRNQVRIQAVVESFKGVLRILKKEKFK